MQNRMSAKTTSTLIIVLLAAFDSFVPSLGAPAKTPGQAVIEYIPNEDRGLFVTFHLSKALNSRQGTPRYDITLPTEAKIPRDKYEDFKNITTYPRYSSDLLEWTKAEFKMNNYDVHQFVTQYSMVCSPSRGCFDVNDVGAMCCPF